MIVYHAGDPDEYYNNGNILLCGKKINMDDEWDYIQHFVREGSGPEVEFRVCVDCKAAITPIIMLKHTEL